METNKILKSGQETVKGICCGQNACIYTQGAVCTRMDYKRGCVSVSLLQTHNSSISINHHLVLRYGLSLEYMHINSDWNHINLTCKLLHILTNTANLHYNYLHANL